MHQFTLPVRALAAVLPFINPGDIRPLIRGAWYGSHGDGSALVATDGSAMVVYRLPQRCEGGPITIPHELVAKASRVKQAVAVVFRAPPDANIELWLGENTTAYASRVRDPFPQWQNAVPLSVSGESAVFAADQMARLAKLAKLHRAGLHIVPDGKENAAVFELVGQPVSGVVMPCRVFGPGREPLAKSGVDLLAELRG